MQPEIQAKLTDFFSHYHPLSFEKGASIIRPDNDYAIYFIQTGFVQQYLETETGDQITFQVFKPMSFFPIMLALTDEKNVYTFAAQTSVKVFKAPKQDVLIFLQ